MKNLAHRFLLPLPDQDGSYFEGSLTYICTHTSGGAAGLIVNRPTPVDFNKFLEFIKHEPLMADPPLVHEGGPVEMNSPSIMHTDDVMVKGSIKLGNDLALTMPFQKSRFDSLLEKIAHGEGPDKFLVMLGYAGWGEGQLDREINDNVWLTCPSSHELLFNVDIDQRAREAAISIGIDLDMLSGDSTGNA